MSRTCARDADVGGDVARRTAPLVPWVFAFHFNHSLTNLGTGIHTFEVKARILLRASSRVGTPGCKVAIQTNNVEVDDRGFIYIVDRANTGLHVLKLTGDALDVVSPGARDGGKPSRERSRKH